MRQTPHDPRKSSELINDLGLAIAGSVGRKVLGIDHQQIEDLKFGPLANRITRLSEKHPSLNELLPPAIPPTDRLDDGSTANLESALRSIITDKESLNTFCSKLGQKLFEEGVKLTRECNAQLSDAEQKVRLLIGVDENGEAITQSFTSDDEDEQ